jgi:uroporphyrinogen-III synthase
VRRVRLLVTRPHPDAARTAAALRARGHAVLFAPLLSVEAVDFELPRRRFLAVVMTSANAARAITSNHTFARLLPLPVFAVGRETAAAARAVGFGEVHAAKGDKEDLGGLVRARLSATNVPLLHLAGEDRAGEFAVDGVAVVTVVVYRAVKAGRFPPKIAMALSNREIDGVLYFSRRTAEAYLDCAGNAGLRDRALEPHHFCLSQRIAEPLLAAGAVRTMVAAQPDETALLDLIGT